jgi:GNAT superfamily N-acetyltransferase
LRLLDGRQAARRASELLAVHDEVYAEPPYRWGTELEDRYAGRLPVLCRQPGFLLAEARHGDYLVGYALGLPLRPSTDWWRDLTSPLPAQVTTEYQGRSFALTDLLVRAPWRRQRIGESLHDLMMAGRREERGLVAVLGAATPAQGAFGRWGWRKIARKQESRPGSPVFDVLVRTLADHPGPLTTPAR